MLGWSHPGHFFPGQAKPKQLTSTQCLSFHQYLTSSERMSWTQESHMRTPGCMPRQATSCANPAGTQIVKEN